MTHINKYLMMAASAVLSSAAMVSCYEKEFVYVADLYQKAYLTTDMYPKNELVYAHSEVTNKDVGWSMEYSDGQILVRQGAVNVDKKTVGADMYRLYFRTVYPVETELSGKLSVASDAEKMVEEYNEKHGLSGEDAYTVLPSEYYTIFPDKLTLKPGTSSAMSELVLSDKALKELNGHYFLPIILTLGDQTPVRDDEIVLAEGKSCVNFLCDIIYRENITGDDSVKPRVLEPDKDFTYSDPLWYYGNGYELSVMFDGNIWSYPFAGDNVPSNVTMTFTEPLYLYKVGGIIGDNNDPAKGWGCPFEFYYTYEGEDETRGLDSNFSTSFGWYNVNEILDPGKKVSSIRMKFIYGQCYMPSDLYLIAREPGN